MATLYPTIKEAMQHLEVGDIVLMRSRSNGLFRRAIRELSQSYWTHAAMVFETVNIGGEVVSVSIVEANETIEVHRLETYVASERYDIGIKRLPGLTELDRDRIRGFFLDALDIPYDYTYIFAIMFARILSFFLGNKAYRWFVKKFSHDNSYICTTFAQRALYLASEPGRRRAALFNDVAELTFVEQMYLVNPQTISSSKNTMWVFNAHE
ncbi:MAG: hypothetical protein H6759_02330 [Candidatus Nomurabacteria bacterium]|nr:hypothetical protein [Candidatus Magasanikbacteria bacterium]USN52877.1 MAG: hypothetical protein H6759_02330 [Candidatus Nomurabacteria bacterium]